MVFALACRSPSATQAGAHGNSVVRRRALHAVHALLASLLLLTTSRDASALDKQGSAHGGALEGPNEGFDVAGAVMLGVALYNPSYAARPGNSGLTLFRYAVHADFDLIGRRLSIPLDVNMFTDGTRTGLRKLIPSEGDLITGVTSTWRLGPGALEAGLRVEHDRTLDATAAERAVVPSTQTYIDARARYLFSLANLWPKLGDRLLDGDVSGWFTLGVFAVNPTYAARPDNSGLALFRYAAHPELSVWHDHLSLGLDGTFFTDRSAKNPVTPSELDFTVEIIGRVAPLALHLAYERDMPVDRGGLVQQFVYALVGYEFDLVRATTRPVGDRSQVPSP